MSQNMPYRLGLDLGTNSIGWAMLRLSRAGEPVAIIRAGVRIFSDGRNPKDGSSLAVTRRLARGMRRRRDRLLKRKARMMRLLVQHGFFPAEEQARKELETLNPYELRSRGLDQKLEPGEFARALFHLTQRRGFKSNRKTDKKDNDSGALKTAIKNLHQALESEKCRTVGEWLYRRMTNGQTVRARYRQNKVAKDDGKTSIHKFYDLYIDRSMVEHEFDCLWHAQMAFNPELFNEKARADLKDTLLFQRNLKPVLPGRCTLIPSDERAPLALPSTQHFRILQELNNLRILTPDLKEQVLTLEQRNKLFDSLEKNSKVTFIKMRRLLGLSGDSTFNLEDAKRSELKGNTTAALLAKDQYFGQIWHDFEVSKQNTIIEKILTEESEAELISWLQHQAKVDEARAELIAEISLPEGYGALGKTALESIVPQLKANVISYAEAVQRASEAGAPFDHHSVLTHARKTGEILPELPYYGEILQRHVGFSDPRAKEDDSPEKKFGRIANPTVHIGLNQVRKVINALIKRYGHPDEVIVEVARELKQSKDQRAEEKRSSS